MYEPTAIDRYLAFHGPKLTGFSPKNATTLMPFVMGAAIAVAIAIGNAFLHSQVALVVLVVAALTAIFAIRARQTESSRTNQTFLQTLYHQVYGQYGWNEDAGPHRSTEPVPIRPAAKILSPEAFELLDSSAAQALRIYSVASASDLGRKATPIVDKTMASLFAHAQGVQAGGPVPVEAHRDLAQLRELADHLSGIRDPAPALTQNGVSPLESLLLDARAEHRARLELDPGFVPETQQQQQQQ